MASWALLALMVPAQPNLGLPLSPSHGPGLISAQPNPSAPHEPFCGHTAVLCPSLLSPPLNFRPILPLTSRLTNTLGSEIKPRREIFSLDLAARRRQCCPSRDAPGKAGGRTLAPPGYAEAAQGRDAPRLRGEQLPPSLYMAEDVSGRVPLPFFFFLDYPI